MSTIALLGDPAATPGSDAATPDNAFARLYARHERALLGYCRALLRDEHDARDVLQSTALRALLSLRDGTEPAHERAWIFRIAHNEAINLMRGRRPQAELDLETPTAAPLPLDTVLLRERVGELIEDVRALPPGARQALLLREVAGLSTAEIAGVTGTSRAAARQAVCEARAALRADRAAHDANCELVRTLIECGDGRRRRTRTTRAHLRGCAECRRWCEATGRPPLLAAFGAPLMALGRWIGVAAQSAPSEGIVAAAAPAGVARGLAVAATVASGAIGISAVHPPARATVRSAATARAAAPSAGFAAGRAAAVRLAANGPSPSAIVVSKRVAAQTIVSHGSSSPAAGDRHDSPRPGASRSDQQRQPGAGQRGWTGGQQPAGPSRPGPEQPQLQQQPFARQAPADGLSRPRTTGPGGGFAGAQPSPMGTGANALAGPMALGGQAPAPQPR